METTSNKDQVELVEGLPVECQPSGRAVVAKPVSEWPVLDKKEGVNWFDNMEGEGLNRSLMQGARVVRVQLEGVLSPCVQLLNRELVQIKDLSSGLYPAFTATGEGKDKPTFYPSHRSHGFSQIAQSGGPGGGEFHHHEDKSHVKAEPSTWEDPEVLAALRAGVDVS